MDKVELNKLELTNTPQDLFDNFNSFILSEDKRVFSKLIARTLLYDKIKHVPGDIVECGVFKGTGIYTFLKLKNIFNPNSSKKVIGFDFFNTKDLISSINDKTDKEAMNSLFTGRDFSHKTSFKEIFHNQILKHNFLESDFELIEGDISLTSKKFADNNPGFKISLLYMDLDLEIPTYNTLVNLWDNVTKGGVIVFDEYGYHKWSESKGVDRFIKEYNLEIKSLNYLCPTAYIQK
jgi:hypothetical protein